MKVESQGPAAAKVAAAAAAAAEDSKVLPRGQRGTERHSSSNRPPAPPPCPECTRPLVWMKFAHEDYSCDCGQSLCRGDGVGLRWCCEDCETDVNPACYADASASMTPSEAEVKPPILSSADDDDDD
eukprot:SAG11_NODE_19648_length_462_cov_0.688705_1_plen_126_part_10